MPAWRKSQTQIDAATATVVAAASRARAVAGQRLAVVAFGHRSSTTVEVAVPTRTSKEALRAAWT